MARRIKLYTLSGVNANIKSLEKQLAAMQEEFDGRSAYELSPIFYANNPSGARRAEQINNDRIDELGESIEKLEKEIDKAYNIRERVQKQQLKIARRAGYTNGNIPSYIANSSLALSVG